MGLGMGAGKVVKVTKAFSVVGTQETLGMMVEMWSLKKGEKAMKEERIKAGFFFFSLFCRPVPWNEINKAVDIRQCCG